MISRLSSPGSSTRLIQLSVFDVLTKPEHVRRHIAPFGEEVTVCSIDLRVGGDYHFAFVPAGGAECSFRGTYLEVEPPTRTVATWLFEGWPDAEAVESIDLQEATEWTKLRHGSWHSVTSWAVPT